MYTPEEAAEIVKGYLDIPAINNAIAGVVCGVDSRPPGSDEDITVGAISLTDNSGLNSTQRGTLNVNFYKKDKNVEGADNYVNQPDTDRLKEVVKTIVAILQGPDDQGLYWKNGNLWISNVSGKLKLEATQEHYINIRVEVKLHPPLNN
jgi:hypothetical protein